MNPKEICTRMFIYEELFLEDALVGNKGIEFLISLKPFDFYNTKNKQNILNLSKSSRLKSGSLLIITNSDLHPMVYATVIYKPE